MSKIRLDQAMVAQGVVSTRSQADSYIGLGKVSVDGKTAAKSGQMVDPGSKIKLLVDEQYVSRAALKLASVTQKLNLDFNNKVVLDVGSSTGGFSDYALKNGAKKVIAVDVGTDQLHPSLRQDNRIELHEKTDIRSINRLSARADIVVIDVSFISLREVLPHIAALSDKSTQIVAMLKPQFEAGAKDTNKGVIKNDSLRRKILKDFEVWAKDLFIVRAKSDSSVAGAKGNLERFYLLQKY
jgi:23S rRNA (cytidine1920-2'-O)/16S rRNA (cytidine1409-2'-O)-methyltransferase